MRNNKIYIFIVLLVIVSIGVEFLMRIRKDYYKQINVEFTFEKKVCLDSLPKGEINFTVSNNVEGFMVCLSEHISAAEINKFEVKKLDFSKFDYLLSFKKEVEKITYSKYYSDTHDFCDYIKEIPVELHYNNESGSSCVFIYKLPEKHKYRHLCP